RKLHDFPGQLLRLQWDREPGKADERRQRQRPVRRGGRRLLRRSQRERGIRYRRRARGHRRGERRGVLYRGDHHAAPAPRRRADRFLAQLRDERFDRDQEPALRDAEDPAGGLRDLVVKAPALLARLARDEEGLAFVEFAFIGPILLFITLAGLELVNY